MADLFLALSKDDRREALAVAADRSGRPIHLLEKDVWVVWTLQTLFSSKLGEHLVFKGGTSLSKAYGVIAMPWGSGKTASQSPRKTFRPLGAHVACYDRQ